MNVSGYNLSELPQKPLGDEFLSLCRKTAAEGVVLLKNDNNALPLNIGEKISVFGRMQNHYVKSGSGSGGLVNVEHIVGIPEGLENAGLILNENLKTVYSEWEETNPYDCGNGWSSIPWSQTEMPIDDAVVENAADFSDIAVAVIGRSSGEDKDNSNVKGSFLLTDGEEDMLKQLRKHFKKVIVLLNVGNIVDMKWVERYNPDAVLYTWQGGQEGGNAIGDIIVGKECPCGKLTDSIAYGIEDYPSTDNFNGSEKNIYREDIYVGYRYFNTFAPEKLIYPFGYGLSYTDFEYTDFGYEQNGLEVSVNFKIKNVGLFGGKEIVQVYCSAPNGMLGKAERVLVAYKKTEELLPGEETTLSVNFSLSAAASYDDIGTTGLKNGFVLESGKYTVCIGANSLDTKYTFEVRLDSDILIRKCTSAMPPKESFKRLKSKIVDGIRQMTEETVPYVFENNARVIPEEIEFTGDRGIKLSDVKNGKYGLDEFIAQLSNEDLACISMGEGMNSPKVTAGCGCAFGGVTESLYKFGIPIACGTDGPSGIRMDSGASATLLPCGTLIACTWNDTLVEELYTLEGIEMYAYNVDVILGPGINIHRNPLNGRNFEYFSEDPLLTGNIAAAICRGIAKSGNTATIKHFCANNQERERNNVDAVVSERALREIYLKPFEIVVREGNCRAVMTAFNPVNGVWCSGNYELTTKILRDEWGFKGIVMTDWWGKTERDFVVWSKPGEKVSRNFEPMVYAQNDIYMVHSEVSDSDFNTMIADAESGKINRAILQRNAANICSFLLRSNAMERIDRVDFGGITVKSENKIAEFKDLSIDDVSVFESDSCGKHIIEIEIASDGFELSQNTVVFYINNAFAISFTVQGANGDVTVCKGKLDLPLGQCSVTAKYAEGRINIKRLAFYKAD